MLSFGVWLCIGFTVRLVVILYGSWHDRWFRVPFTDVDYFVFSDAAQFVASGKSPYDRETYRYPPLVAWLLVPNVLYPIWGKILFSSLDLLVSTLLFGIIRAQGFPSIVARRCALLWLLNPVSIIISARGNSDSIIAAVVLMALSAAINNRPAITGILLALAIHIRLYPLVFSFPIYLSFSNYRIFTGFRNTLQCLIPNCKQLTLVFTCITFLASCTALCFYLYGDKYLHESIFYHLTRKDSRHNFSLFFYLIYLNPKQPGVLLFLPQTILLLVLGACFHQRKDMAFCLFAQSFVVVTYNPVVTSQYWVWVFSLLPACLPRMRITVRAAGLLSVLWLMAQLAWLVPAFLLEFRGRNTFFFLWLQGIGVFCANVAVLGRLVRDYDYALTKRD